MDTAEPGTSASAGSVPKEEKCQAVSESGDVIAFAKR